MTGAETQEKGAQQRKNVGASHGGGLGPKSRKGPQLAENVGAPRKDDGAEKQEQGASETASCRVVLLLLLLALRYVTWANGAKALAPGPMAQSARPLLRRWSSRLSSYNN